MNKNLYRIVFNQARGLMMAVAEIASARGKGTSNANSLGVTRGNALQVQFAKLKLLPLATQLACGAVLLFAPIVQAQIIPDAAAPGNQRPTVISAPNGVPLVNIQTPSAAGVSRNTYSQFDVQRQGVILNNANTITNTQLGGFVAGNPNLVGGTARVILNEVNSSNPSQLRGYIEVGGDRAQVIVANPSGITCDGCGFINANRATLTTGTPILNGGSLDGYLVQRGAITIEGAGLDGSQANFTDIISRAVQVNAGIFAQELKVTAGANQVSADLSQITPIAGVGSAPAFAIDVAQLGGMYAGKITLIGTEAGVGVRNAGTIGASAGEVLVTVDGRIENSGRINSTSHTRIVTKINIDNSGTITAQGNTTLAATGAASQIVNSTNAVLGAGINADGSLAGSGDLTINATQSAQIHGQSLSGGNQSISAGTLDLSDGQNSSRNLALSATSGDINAINARITVAQALTANTPGALNTNAAILSANQLDLNAGSLSNVKGEIVQTGTGDTSLNLSGTLDNNQGRIAVNSRNLGLTAQTLANTDGAIEHASSGKLALIVGLHIP